MQMYLFLKIYIKNFLIQHGCFKFSSGQWLMAYVNTHIYYVHKKLYFGCDNRD